MPTVGAAEPRSAGLDERRGRIVAKETGYALISFGDLLLPPDRVIPRDYIREKLIKNDYWLLARVSRVISPGTNLLFYMNAAGVVATARATKVEVLGASHKVDGVIRAQFRYFVGLEAVRTAIAPISIRPFIPKLQFIRNKKFWGHALRSTPRAISKHDFEILSREV